MEDSGQIVVRGDYRLIFDIGRSPVWRMPAPVLRFSRMRLLPFTRTVFRYSQA